MKGNSESLFVFNVFVQSIKTTNKSNLAPCCTFFSSFVCICTSLMISIECSKTLGYHKLSFDSYHSMNMENKLKQAGSVCMPNTITVNQYTCIYTKMKHVLNTTGDFDSDETKKNQVLFLSQLVT